MALAKAELIDSDVPDLLQRDVSVKKGKPLFMDLFDLSARMQKLPPIRIENLPP